MINGSTNSSVSNNTEPTTTAISIGSTSVNDNQTQKSNVSSGSAIETSKVASQPQQLVEKQNATDVGSSSTMAGNTQSQTQSVVETAYKPVNRPMTQTEQMVVDANNENNTQTANNSEQGQNANAKAMPQTGELNSQAMAEIGLTMLGVIATAGLAIDKKRFS